MNKSHAPAGRTRYQRCPHFKKRYLCNQKLPGRDKLPAGRDFGTLGSLQLTIATLQEPHCNLINYICEYGSGSRKIL